MLNFMIIKMDFDNRKDDPVKQNLRRLLSDTIEEVCLIHSNISFLDFGENATTNLCMVIEAIFLHGLRNSLLNKARSLFFQDFNSSPTNLDFWSLVLIISHKEVIKQIEKLRFINTDIGKCRVWVRISLSEKTLASYFKSIKSNSRVMSKYFSENAFLRDKNCVQIAENLITSVEKCKDFKFNLNSSLLNSWPSKTLTFVGLWNQAIKPKTEVATAIDIVNSIKDDEKINENDLEFEYAISDYSYELSISNATSSTNNELLEKKYVNNADNFKPTESFNEFQESILSDETVETVRGNDNQSETTNDTNNNSKEVIESDDNCITESQDNEKDENLLKVHTDNDDNWIDKSDDYMKLLDCYRYLTGTIRLRSYVEEIQSGLVTESDLIIQLQDEIDDNLKKSLYKITKSCGLDNQNFECDKCRKQLISNYHLCHYTSKYYCSYCIDDQLYALPAKILYNWDFCKYSISKDAAIFLKRIKNKPIFNCQTWNPLIYEKVQIMSKVLQLRKQLVLIGAYLFTCRNIKNAEDGERSVPKHYVYTDVHLYSLKDFEQIFNGTYIKTCNKMFREHVCHIQECYLCTQKGFICEICQKDHIIFPFDMQNTFLCYKCNALYHKTCYHSIEYCKKCKRKVQCDDNTVQFNNL